METPKINFLNSQHHKKQKNGQKLRSKIFFYPAIFIILFILFFSFQIIISGNGLLDTLESINIFGNSGLTLNQNKLLQGEADNRINILLLGIGGEGHDGPYLTDTMVLASIEPKENKVALISIPRDLSVPIPGYGWRKINEADSFGEVKAKGKGGEFAAEVVSKVFNLPIHYYIRADFSGFEKVINQFGGINVYVDNSFVDNEFPTDNYGYQTVSFKQGWQKMNGQTALNYARSRHGSNGEGSDFARSKRQQKILQAVKDEALSFSTFLSYRKMSALYDLYAQNIKTNLQIWELYRFAKIARGLKENNISRLVFSDDPAGPLYATNINGAYLLLPKDMSFYQVQQQVANVFNPTEALILKEKTKVEIQNGTKIEGLASKTSASLKIKGYEIVKMCNAVSQNYDKTVIYDLTNGAKKNDLDNLQKDLNAQVAFDKPNWLPQNNGQTDFIIILGKDQQSLSKLD
jgi:polyisoprenyl-teichoic acid--peptidoglycan teichoic acid transferase